MLERTTATTGVLPGFAVLAPLRPLAHDLDDVTLCYVVAGSGQAAVVGGSTPLGTPPATVEGETANGSLSITYLRAGRESWWSYASTVARRIGMGRGDWGGAWMAWLAAALALAAVALAVRALVRTVVTHAPARAAPPAPAGPSPAAQVRRALRRLPCVGWTVLVVGVLNALAWSLITPPFQAPDEETHVAYVQQIGERGRPPVRHPTVGYSPELSAVLAGVRFGTLGASRPVPALWSPVQQQRLDAVLHVRLARHGTDDAGPADPEPPLYYALEAIPYRLARGATLLDRITLMRTCSALLAGATALLALLFVRECLPGRPWAWTVGGLTAAFVPLVGFISGAVNPDALLFAVSAALLLSLAHAFRRGLTTRRAVAIGVVLGVGAVAKINFYGLVPGALVGLALAARISAGAWNARAARLVAIAVGIGLAPYVLLSALDLLVWERAFILARTPSAIVHDHGGLGGELSYLWQLFLPRLSGQGHAFPELAPPYDLWITGFLGRFGWVTVEYPGWAYRFGAAGLAAIVLLATAALVRQRAVVRRRRAELAGYALIAGGLLLLIAMVALRGWAPGIKGAVQGRYLLPLLGLFAALVALAARGAGERWGRAVGVAIVALAIAWSVFGQLLTVAYYYG